MVQFMGVIGRLDGYQRRHRWAGLPLAVAYKFVDDQGGYLTALITYYGFVSLFPLLLLLVTGLGFVLQNNAGAQQRVLDSALAHFPVIGDQIATNIHSFHGSILALIVGIATSLYGGLGVIQATQNALNKMWGVPRGARPNPITSRLRSLVLLLTGGTAIVVTSLLSGISATGIGGAGVRAAGTVLAVAVNAALFTVTFRVLTARRLPIADVRAGAIAAALIWQGLQWGGALLLGHLLKGATATYGLFGIVLGLLAWIYLGAVTFIVCAEVNVVRALRLWPRSLLAPFTDQIAMTPGDRRAYTSYAQAERHKGFQNINVDFDQTPDRPAADDVQPGQAEPR